MSKMVRFAILIFCFYTLTGQKASQSSEMSRINLSLHQAQNPLASVTKRLRAIETLLGQDMQTEVASILLDWIQNEVETPVLKAKASSFLISLHDAELDAQLTYLLNSAETHDASKKRILYILYKRNPTAATQLMMKWIENHHISDSLKKSALSYLSASPEASVGDLLTEIAKDKTQSELIRISALTGLEKITSFNRDVGPELLLTIIENASEAAELQKAALILLNTYFDSTVTDSACLNILRNANNQLSIRRLAIDILRVRNNQNVKAALAVILKTSSPIIKQELTSYLEELEKNGST